MQNSGISSPATTTSRQPAGPTRNRFSLKGRSSRVDPRIDAARRDLADVRLADRVFAPHYASAVPRIVIAPALLYDHPGGAILSEILPGERFDLLELTSTHGWGVSAADGAVGYVCAKALGEGDITAPPTPPAPDPAAAAETLLDVPAKPGGRSAAGLDSDGLIFLALRMAGIEAPRFLDLQALTLGAELPEGTPHARGDLLFFEDHAAILVDPGTAIHVGDDGVVREALAAIVDGRYGAPAAWRRLA